MFTSDLGRAKAIIRHLIDLKENLVYSVRLAGSNNNIFDVDGGILNPNSVTIIGQNSAGLVVVGTSSLSVTESLQLDEIHQDSGLDSERS